MNIFRRIADSVVEWIESVHPFWVIFCLCGMLAGGLLAIAKYSEYKHNKRDCAFWAMREEGREPGKEWSYAAKYCDGDGYGGVGHKLYLELKKKYGKYDK
jgi:hypothetical protein